MAARARPAILATAMLAVLSAGAGCGGGSGGAGAALGPAVPLGPPSPAALSAVIGAAKTTLAQRAVVSFRLTAPQVFGSGSSAVTGSGAFDLAASRGQVSLHQVTGRERVVFLPASVFVAGAGATLLPRGKVWISAGLTEQSLATNFPQFVTQAESLNPALLLSELAWGATSSASSAATGKDSAYTVVVDLAQAEQNAAGPSATAFARAITYEITEQSGGPSPTLKVRVVVDSEGRVKTVEASPPGAGIGTVTLALSDWGTTVTVSQPPRAQVVDISTLAPGGERENAAGGDSDGA